MHQSLSSSVMTVWGLSDLLSLLAAQQLLSVLYKINTLAVSIFDCYVTVQCISTIITVPSLGLDPIKNEDIFKRINGGSSY